MSRGSLLEEVRRAALKHALLNAVRHGGRAQVGPVMGKVIGEIPEAKSSVKEVLEVVSSVVEEVNRLSLEEQYSRIEKLWPEELERTTIKTEKELPPLPNVDKYPRVVTRFAPNPDFVLTLGNARAAILSYEYAKMYDGKFILRFEDTDPRVKSPIKEAYELIREDLRWLGIRWDEEYLQSLRMDTYYNLARELILRGGAYVDKCPQSTFRDLRDRGIPCPHRRVSVEDNLEEWDKMIAGYYSEGEAVLRVKTDLKHPDRPVRDWVAFRIIDTSKNPHPITGDKYLVWPTYNFAAGVDDHLMGITHILRGKEHAQNTVKQLYLYKHFNWEYPEAIHFGRLKFEGLILSKSQIRKLVEEGGFEGYDDPRFGTLASFRKRGFLPESIREVMVEVGIKSSDASISFENIAAINRKLVDKKAPRLMFVDEPFPLVLEDAPSLQVEIPYHPDVDLGSRRINIGEGEVLVYVSRRDVEMFKRFKIVRLMELANLEVKKLTENSVTCKIHSFEVETARKLKTPIIQWVPLENVKCVVVRAVEDRLEEVEGICEKSVLRFKPGSIVQFVRFGFVRLHKVSSDFVKAYYSHP